MLVKRFFLLNIKIGARLKKLREKSHIVLKNLKREHVDIPSTLASIKIFLFNPRLGPNIQHSFLWIPNTVNY